MNSPFLHRPNTGNPAPNISPVTTPTQAPQPTPVNNTQAHPKADARPIEAAAQLLKNAETKFKRHLDSINPVGLDGARLHREISAFAHSPAAAQIDEAIDIAARRQADAEKNVADIVAGLSPKGDVAEELRAGRTWDRTTRVLDATPAAQRAEVARKLIANSSDDELGVLLAELPSYLDAQGTGSEWLDTVAAERVPALAAARQEAKKAAQSRQILNHDAELLRARITNTVAPQAYQPVAFIDTSRYDPDGA